MQRILNRLQRPTGQLSQEVLHVLSWAPEPKGGRPPFVDTLDLKNPSLKFVSHIFPDVRQHAVIDVYPLREELNKYIVKPNGSLEKVQQLLYVSFPLTNSLQVRRTSKEIYERSPFYQIAVEYFHSFITQSAATVIIIWGAHARNQVQKVFKDPIYCRGDGTACHLYYVNHPERILRWSAAEELERNSNTLDEITQSFPGLIRINNIVLTFREHAGKVLPTAVTEPHELYEAAEGKFDAYWISPGGKPLAQMYVTSITCYRQEVYRRVPLQDGGTASQNLCIHGQRRIQKD